MAALDSISLLLFRLHDDLLAINVKVAIEVLVSEDLIPIPGKVDLVKGLLHYRGDYIPVINTRKKFFMPEYDGKESCVIVVLEMNINDISKIGIIVDKVHGIHTTQEKSIKPMEGVNSVKNNFIEGIIDTSFGPAFVLKAKEIFSDSEIVLLNEISKI